MTSSAENGWELSVTRLIAAPPEHVWHVMTKRQEEWWCPVPWRAEIVEQDWRAGGRSSMMFKGPNGEEMPQDGVFLEVVPGKRFVTTDAFRPGWTPAGSFMVGGWEIEPEANGTRYRAWARHWNEDTYKQHRDMGFEDGWAKCAEQLAELCEAVK
jgi:uncharacterized protein YndB with AHSA1/START domain